MKKRVSSYLLLIVLLAFNYGARATHIYGGDLLYEYISGTEYKVTLTIYGDCSGTNFYVLARATPVLDVLNNGILFQSVSLLMEPGTGKEVTPVCPEDSGKTACKMPNAPLPGIAEYKYSAIVDIPFSANDWAFIFAGNTGSGAAGRTNAIGNIVIPAMNGSLMYLEAHLNNTKGPNSSPKYTSIPTPFFCINKQQEYNQGAVDPDNDSLYFLLTPALETSTTTVTYIPPYTAIEPLATAPKSFNYNNVNGQMSFLPNLGQVSLIANKIEEYKNGILVGSSMREMTFIVLNNCGNSPPLGKIDSNVTGGVAAPNSSVNVCQGTERVAFTISPVDADNDKVNVTSTGVPFGGVLTISNNNTTHPVINFSWTTTPDQALGPYTFFLNYKDDGCPLSSNQTVAYTINVVKNFTVSHEVLFPTQCAHNAYVQLTAFDGATPKVITVYQKERVIATYVDSTHKETDPFIVQDSFKKGSYLVVVSSPYLKCITTYNFDVVDSGVFPFPPFYKSKHFCLNDNVQPINLYADSTVLKLNWYDTSGTKLPAAPTYKTDDAWVYTWQISQTHLTCESDKVDFSVFIHSPPTATILNIPAKVCLGDQVYLLATGGVTYKWLPEDKVYTDANNNAYTKVMSPTTYTVIAKSGFGCADTASITYDNIENCCTFSYPTAFTPNGDGKNDGFRAILYGNAADYIFFIYNRWGQQVFHTDDPNISWDGNYNGTPCEVGTYYYRVKGTCLTGHKEESSGDFLLIR